jgi:Bacterial Ig-like domain
MRTPAADYTGTVAFRRSIPLLCALVALLGLPASALAQDVTPPVNTTAATPVAWQTADYTVALTGTDADSGIATMQWRLNGSAETNVANGATATITDSGVHNFETRATDVEGLDSGWRSEQLRIDKILPIDGTDPGTLAWRPAATSVQVLAMDVTSGLDHVEWQLDGGLVQTGPNASVVPIASDGVHTLRTRAVDVAGNVSVWRDHTVRVDTVTPTDTTAAPAGWQTSPLNVSVGGSDAHSGIASLAWRLNGGAITSGPPPVSLTVSAQGEHVLETRVTDGAGHESGWKSHTIRIDTTAPANQTPVASSAWRATDYAVMVSGADDGSGLARVEWRVDAGPVTSGASPLQATVSGTGTHTLETRSVDVAGNASLWRSESVRIDSVAPTNTTTSPSGPVANPYTVSVTGNDPHSGISHVEWRIDGGVVQSGPAASQATVTGDGAHTLATRIVDLAGNASAWRTDDVDIDILLNNDTTVPTDTTETAPAGWRADPVTLTISATDAGTGMDVVQWRIDGASIVTISGGTAELMITEEGVHELETRGRDLAGNVSAWRLQTIRMDFSVPTDTTAIPTAWQSSRNVTLTATDTLSGIADIEYKVNGGPVLHAANNQVINVGADGTFTIAHRVIDGAGQATAFKTDTLRVDTVLPANTTAVPLSTWRAVALELPLTGTDAGSGLATMQWRVDGGAIHDGSPAVVDTDGVHTLETRAVDTAGNQTAWRSDTIRVDTTVPVNDTLEPASDWLTTPPYTVLVEGSDGTGSGVARIERTIDGGAVSQDPNVSIAADGVYELRTRIVDNVGHASAWRTDTVRIDSTAPVNTTEVPDPAWQPTTLALALSGTDATSGVATMQWRVDSGDIEDGGPAVIDTDGVYTLETRAVDAAGNASAWRTDTVSIDTVLPVNDTPEPAAGWRSTPYTVLVEGSDGGSGVDRIERTIDGGAVSEDPDVTISADGEHPLLTRIVDLAGNASAWRTDTIKIDSVDPVVGLACSPASGWSNHAVTCTASANGGPSGVASLTSSRNGGTATAVANGGAVVVSTDGVHVVRLNGTDGAGNTAFTQATVRVDRTVPAATLTCAADSGTAYTCRATGSDATSGLATLSYSLNGGAWTAVPAAGSFPIRRGAVRVRALDAAGNQGLTGWLTLASRAVVEKPPVVTASSSPVYLAGHTDSDSLVGAMRAKRSANGTVSVDLRPLAVGRGKFRVQIKLTSGKRSKTVKRTVKVGKGGTLPRIAGSLSKATAKCTVKLTVFKRAGGHWRRFATSKVVLAG